MDKTLAELEMLVRSSPTKRWLSVHKTHLRPLRLLCPCGLNPLLEYFSTGAAAADSVLSGAESLSGAEISTLWDGWHFLAQGEIQDLCGCCRRVCAPALSFPVAQTGHPRQSPPVADAP